MYSRCIKINLLNTRYIKLYWTDFTDLMDSTKLEGPSPFFRTEHRWPIYLRLRYKKKQKKPTCYQLKLNIPCLIFFLICYSFRFLIRKPYKQYLVHSLILGTLVYTPDRRQYLYDRTCNGGQGKESSSCYRNIRNLNNLQKSNATSEEENTRKYITKQNGKCVN